MTKKERMYEQIERHGAKLNAIFNTGIDNIKLCKKLHSLEVKAHRATTCLCNTNTIDLLELNRFTGYDVKQVTEEEMDRFFEAILDKVDKILNFRKQDIPVFVNHDPRGYALKIKSSFMINNTLHCDFGGYGILAPEFDGGK